MDKKNIGIKPAKAAVAQEKINHVTDNKEDNTMKYVKPETENAQPETPKATRIHVLGEKVRTTFTTLSSSSYFKTFRTAFLAWLDNLPEALGRGCLRGFVIGILLNVIASYFWPELPETIPTIYGFFNGFVELTEFLYKVALGGIAALFNGTFIEFGDTVMVEISELWNAFTTWISAISF